MAENVLPLVVSSDSLNEPEASSFNPETAPSINHSENPPDLPVPCRLPDVILSNRNLEDWRGSLTVFERFTGTIPVQPSASEPSVTSNAFPEGSLLRYSSGWDNRTWALYWCAFGLDPIPILPAEKHPAVKWDPWLDGLDEKKIYAHWSKYPDHEIGCIVGDGLIVLDADTVQSGVMLKRLEESMGVTPGLIISTKRGEHHYFRRGSETVAKSDSHCSEKYPYRLDVKTGRAIAILPPSTGKSIKAIVGDHRNNLPEVGQSFIDKVCELNGRQASSTHRGGAILPRSQSVNDANWLSKLARLLESISPDCGYDDWLHVGMALFHETAGSDAGLELYNVWSKDGISYQDFADIQYKWGTFHEVPNQYTVATLIWMARKGGADTNAIMYGFYECECEVVNVGK